MKGKKEIIIGLCVLIALGVLYFGVEFLKGVNVFKPSNAYTASYTNVAGLQVSAPVTINGLKVGQVSSIEYEYDNPGHVKVAFSLDKALQVPAGSKAVIEQDLLGTASVVLHFTDAKEYVPRGSSLKGLTSAGLMGDVSEKLLPSVDRIMNQVDTLLTNLNTVMGDPAIHSSVQRLDQITLSIEQTMRQLNTTVGALPPVMKNVNGITTNLNTVSSDLATFSGRLNELPLDSVMNNMVALSANLRTLSAELSDPNSTLGALTHDRALYNNLNAAAASLDSLLIDVKRNPKRYISIKLL